MTFEEILRGQIADQVIGGAVIVAGDSEKIQFVYECGSAVPGAEDRPMRRDTVIDIASVTKVVVTATALGICRDHGLVDFDRPFTDYLPEYTGKLKAPVTLRDLALHISGFVNPAGKPRIYMADDGKTIRANFLRCSPLFPVRTHYEYCCWNYLLLGAIVENLVKCPLDQFAAREIFAPLGMVSSAMGAPKEGTAAVRLSQTEGAAAPGTISDPAARRLFRDGLTAGNAGAFSTADDLARFCAWMLREEGILSHDSFCELKRNCMPTTFDVRRSFGWVIEDAYKPKNFSEHTIYHSGWSGQSVYVDWRAGRYVIVLTSRCGDYERAKRGRALVAAQIIDRW